jgi:hypothetical protein
MAVSGNLTLIYRAKSYPVKTIRRVAQSGSASALYK